jgi:hypothetical protein
LKKNTLKKRTIFRVAFYLLLLMPLFSFLTWWFWPSRKINVVILDKTANEKTRAEHKSFSWILSYEKFRNAETGKLFRYYKDYFGFFPLEGTDYYIDDLGQLTKEQLDSIANKNHIFYATDTYGVYYDDWYGTQLLRERSSYLYGGLEENDLYLLKKMYELGKLTFAEFNTLGSPTKTYIVNDFAQEFGIKPTGWTARYFDFLDTLKYPELPRWIIKNYQKQYKKPWRFKEPGMVFVHEDGSIVITEYPQDKTFQMPVIETEKKFQKNFGVDKQVRYPYWIEIISADTSLEVISNFRIYSTVSGDSILRANQIPRSFPATVRKKNVGHFYYFCGDFADNPVKSHLYYFKGSPYMDFLFYNNRDISDRKKFFWRYYLPLMQEVLNTYYNNEIKTGNI